MLLHSGRYHLLVKTVLVNLPLDWGKTSKFASAKGSLYPFSLLYIASYLYRRGISSKILDCEGLMLGRKEFRRQLQEIKPDVIGFTATTRNRYIVYEEIKFARNVLPSAKIVVGGKHFTPTAEEALRHLPQIDVVVCGEGEETFYELLCVWRQKVSLAKVKGICFRKSGRIIHNPSRNIIKNLDELDIDEEVIPKGKYSHTKTMRHFKDQEAIPILLGRGCPNQCTYCTQSTESFRIRSLSGIMKEIEKHIARNRIKYFHFFLPSFTINKPFVKDFCREIIARNMNIRWYCESRVDVDLELISLMREAGCVSLDFSFESGSEKVLKNIRKNIKPGQVLPFAKACNSMGIRSLVFSMISLPGETEDDAQITLDMIKKIAPYVYKMTNTTLQIFPGTEIERQAKEKGILPDTFSWYDTSFKNPYNDLGPECIPLYFEHLSPDWIRNIWLPAYRKIYYKHFMKSDDFIRFAKKTLLNWDNEGFAAKIQRMSKAVNFIKTRITK